MVAYASLVPLGQSLRSLLYSSRVSLLPPSEEIIQSAYDVVISLFRRLRSIEVLEETSEGCERPEALNQQVKEAVHRVEDVLEPYLSSQYLSQIEGSLALDPNSRTKIIIDLEEVKQELNSFIAFVIKIKVAYVKYEDNLRERQNDSYDYLRYEPFQQKYCTNMNEYDEDDEEMKYDDEDLLSTSNYQMVGLVDQFVHLRSLLIQKSSPMCVSILGMVGIGKTAMAIQLYNDPLILKHFEYRAFAKIGHIYQLKQVIVDILSQLKNLSDNSNLKEVRLEDLLEHLQWILERSRCLLVLDDVWNTKLYFNCFKKLEGRKSRILLTTRIASVARILNSSHDFRMRFLNAEESWSLFCMKVFGKDSWCPFDFIETGKKIVENCEGLPLMIVAVADLLAKGDKTLDYWKKVSQDPNPLSIGTNDQHPMLDGLYTSYDKLYQRLKTYFLYMGVFPRKHEIVASKLINLWIAEGLMGYITQSIFYESGEELLYRRSGKFVSYIKLQHEGMKYIERLSDQSVVVVTKSSSKGRIRICKLHSVFWHMCIGEARKENFFQVLNKYSSSCFAEVIKGQRRLCVHNNTLFGIKDAYYSMSSISNARSLLCTGPYHDYPVPMCFEMRLLKVLDALSVRFYDFPLEVVKLFQLRYLAFTYDGMLHASISQLWNLEFLIVKRHLSIVSIETPCYLPAEIWNMKELAHLHVMGAMLPEPCDGAILEKLTTILDINAQSLTEEVVSSMPNLGKLGIQIDSSTHDPFSFADQLCYLHKLESLKCIVINPKPKSQAIAPPPPDEIFPLYIVKLSLSGFGYPWKYMQELERLRFLEVLKLRNYAFQGPEWEVDLSDYPRLKALILEDLDLQHWRVTPNSEDSLERLVIRHCYRLQEFPVEVVPYYDSHIKLIELVDIKPSVVASARHVVQQQNKKSDSKIQLHADCSWEDGN